MTSRDRLIWMLGRMLHADEQIRDKGAPPIRIDSFWEPGSVWPRGNDLQALRFAVFMTGVALDAAGGLKGMTAALEAFEAEHGEIAGAWLAARWSGIGDFHA